MCPQLHISFTNHMLQLKEGLQINNSESNVKKCCTAVITIQIFYMWMYLAQNFPSMIFSFTMQQSVHSLLQML
jgi:hypothetical protein